MYKRVYELVKNIKAIDTHCHHLQDDLFVDFNLDRLLAETYVNWTGIKFDNSRQSKENYLNKVKYNSYFRILQNALKNLYDITEDLNVDNWELYSEKITQKHGDSDWHKTILKKYCNYEKVILDAYWNPGSINNDPDIFVSTFRIDPLFYGYDKKVFDHDGHNAYVLFNREFFDIDEFLAFTRELIINKIKQGSVSIKNAIAYDRSINYKKTTKDQAQRVFTGYYTSEDVAAFQDYFFFEVCKLAAELDVPIQCHTGMGCLNNTQAINMLQIIKMNPNTKFVLLHGGFPWRDDILAYLHACPNVYSDICWLPLLSPTAAENTLHQLIEVGTSDKICWGCDTWTSEESYGARMSINSVLANVLSSKIMNGYLNMNDAECIATNILYNNAKNLYKL